MYIAKTPFFDPETGEFKLEKVGEEIVPDPEIEFFKTDRETLTDEAPIYLSWQVRFAVNVTVNNIPVELSGTMPFHSTKPATVALVAKNKLNKIVEQHLYIGIDKTPPEIEFFKADKLFVIKNYPVTLSWKVLGATSIRINNGIGEVNQRHYVVVKPNENSIYTLKASNYFGYSSEIDLAITVFPLPLIEGINIPLKQFTKDKIVLLKPLFYQKPAIQSCIEIRPVIFTEFAGFTGLDQLTSRIILKRRLIQSVLFPSSIFSKLIKKQRKITQFIQSIWKKKIKKELKSLAQ